MITLTTRDGIRTPLSSLSEDDALVLAPYLKGAALVELVEREIGKEDAPKVTKRDKPMKLADAVKANKAPKKDRKPRASKPVDVDKVRAVLGSEPRSLDDIAADLGVSKPVARRMLAQVPGVFSTGKTKAMRFTLATEAA